MICSLMIVDDVEITETVLELVGLEKIVRIVRSAETGLRRGVGFENQLTAVDESPLDGMEELPYKKVKVENDRLGVYGNSIIGQFCSDGDVGQTFFFSKGAQFFYRHF